jgi:hypothetical protein
LNKYHIGRTRIRAAALISKHFPEWIVAPEDIKPATGRNRSDWRMDVFRWELFAYERPGLPLVLGSMQTLTEFVRLAAKYGIHVDWLGREIYAKRK